MVKSLFAAALLLWVFPLHPARAQPSQVAPRWYADVALGGNKVVSDNTYFSITGIDLALTVGMRAHRSPNKALVVAATGHYSDYHSSVEVSCPSIPGVVCQASIPVLPLADVMVGAEFTGRFAAVRALVGPTVHRSSEYTTDYMWGTQVRTDVLVPVNRRLAGVVSFRHSWMSERFGNRVSIRGISGGFRVQ